MIQVNKRLRVLFVTSAFPSPDKNKFNAHNMRSVLAISNSVERIQVLHLRSWKPWRAIWDKYRLNGVDVWAFSFPYLRGVPGFAMNIMMLVYKRIVYHFFLKNELPSYDVIHSAGIAMESVVSSYFSKKSGKKHIAQCMGSDVNVELPMLISLFAWKGFEKHVEHFTCNSNALKLELKKILPNINSTAIYRGVDLAELQFKPVKKPFDNICFLYLGGFISSKKSEKYDYKGGVTLAQVWRELLESKKQLKKHIRLFMAGPGINENKVKNVLLEDPAMLNIEVLGNLSPDIVQKYIEQCSVVIVPSFFEGLPNVAVEAAAIGRPVIGSSVGGMPEIVLNGRSGLLFNPKKKDEIKRCILYYVFNPEKIDEHGLMARRIVEQSFDFKTFVQKYLELYSS